MNKAYTENHPLLGTVIVLTHTSEEHDIVAKIAPEYGSNLFSLFADGNELIYCDASALAEREKIGTSDFTGTPVLFPHPNRVRNEGTDREWVFKGKTYSLSDVQIPRGNAPLVHGIVRDRHFDFAILPDQGAAETWVNIDTDSPYFSGFPFPCELRLRFEIGKDGLSVKWKVHNKGNEELPFGFALHPAFVSNEQTLIQLPAKYTMEADEDLLPTGELIETQTNNRFDLNTERLLQEIHLDDVFAGLSDEIPPSVRRPEINTKLSVKSDADKAVLYTFERDKLVCLEPQWGATNTHNLYAKGFPQEVHGLHIVAPGKEDSGYALFKIDFEK